MNSLAKRTFLHLTNSVWAGCGASRNPTRKLSRCSSLVPPDFPEALKVNYGLALAYFEEGDYAKCIEKLKGHTTPGATSASVLSLRGVAEEKSGETEQAYNTFRLGIELFPAD